MELYLHDANVNDPIKGKMRAPTHAGTLRNIDYEYQAEQWLIDVFRDHPDIVAIESSDGRWWDRQNDGFVLRP